MLCPECRQPAPGGTPCPKCKRLVPERERFGGQGGHYLRLLIALSLLFFVVFSVITGIGRGFRTTVHNLYTSGWIWLYLAIFLIPIGVGIYYWFMLREEEITITDTHIIRRSRWGNESLAWADVRLFRRERVPFRRTRLGRVAGLSRFLVDGQLFVNLIPFRYDLVGPPDANGTPYGITLEPGTIEDMPWLLELVEERIGPPIDE